MMGNSLQWAPIAIGISVALISGVVLLGAWWLLQRRWTQRRASALAARWAAGADAVIEHADDGAHRSPLSRALEAIGRTLAPESQGNGEERQLLEQSGWRAPSAWWIFMGLRFALAALGLAVGALASVGSSGKGAPGWLLPVGGAIAGWLLPKLVLHAVAARRVARFRAELPLFVDLVGLLQSVGLSMEQSLYSLGQSRDQGLDVIGHELEEANRLVYAGRARMDAMDHIAACMHDDDFLELVSLLRQIERYGGDVSTSLKTFSERLHEKRRMALRERVGKITVKMTMVMVLTMLPALLLLTAGPGFLGILRSLERMGG